MKLLRPYNPLGFPGGAPGFDLSHPAAMRIGPNYGFSAIATGKGMFDITTGQPGANINSPTFAINGTIGPEMNYTGGGGAETRFTGKSTVNDTTATLAGIILTPPSLATGDFVATSDANNGLSMGILAAAGGRLNFACPGVNGQFTNFIIPVSTPLFVVASWNGSSINFVQLNLANGEIVSETDVFSVIPIAPNGIYRVGNSGGGSFVGYVAAAMFAPSYMSMPQLRAWAQDPWSFWYPRTQQQLIFDSLQGPQAAAFLAAWAAQRNRVHDGWAT